MDLVVAAEPPSSPEAERLVGLLDAELHALYPASSVHGFGPEAPGAAGAFLIVRVGGEAVGCGAVRPLEPGVGEIKRMFVVQGFRGRGIARAILGALEAAARPLGLTTLRLETGTRQPEAIGLYESCGYRRIQAFGEYASDPYSVCFEKVLAS